MGLNLRFYIKNKQIDSSLEKSAKEHPNNGIVIVCDDYKLDGKELKLKNFSVINGGQTTNRIGNMDIDEDFYLQCKVIVKPEEGSEDFIKEVAIATNSQKPIKQEDLDAHSTDQLELGIRLKALGVFYKLKRGATVDSRYSMPYQVLDVKTAGKYGLASIMQKPGTARNSQRKIYDSDNYPYIFGANAPAGFLADSAKIAYYYANFVKNELKNLNYDPEIQVPIFRNGVLWQIAIIALISKLLNGTIDYNNDIRPYLNDKDTLKKNLSRISSPKDKIIHSHFDNEEELFYELFKDIGIEILSYRFEFEKEIAAEKGEELNASNFLKNDNNYYHLLRYIVKIINNKSSNAHKLLAKGD